MLINVVVLYTVHDAVKHKYNFLYLRLDAEPPRAFQFGADGMFEYDINTVMRILITY